MTTEPAMTILSLGGGVQSSTIAEMIVEGELRKPDAVLFADTGDEPQYVYDQVEYLAERLEQVGVPLVTVSAGNMIDDLYNGSRFAAIPVFTRNIIQQRSGNSEYQVGRMRRQCTREYKIDPINKWGRQELLKRELAKQFRNGAIRVNRGVIVEKWLGISLDEVQRMKKDRLPWVTTCWPLIDARMSRADCVAWLESRNLPVPLKSSCRICPFHGDPHWYDMKINRPADWAHVCQIDDDLRSGELLIDASTSGDLYIHRSCNPLRETQLSPEGQAAFDFCGGACFT